MIFILARYKDSPLLEKATTIRNGINQAYALFCSTKIFLTAGAIESYRIVYKFLSKFKKKKNMLEKSGFGKYFQDHLKSL